jgi:hypothetical protein
MHLVLGRDGGWESNEILIRVIAIFFSDENY